MSVIEDVCYVHGHRIQSLRSSDQYDPKTGIAVQRYEVRCIQCGKGVDEIEKHKRAGKPRKPKAEVTNEHNSNPTGGLPGNGGLQAGSEDSLSGAVRSAERPMFEP